MLQNNRVINFIIFQLLRENKQGGGGQNYPSPSFPQLRLGFIDKKA